MNEELLQKSKNLEKLGSDAIKDLGKDEGERFAKTIENGQFSMDTFYTQVRSKNETSTSGRKKKCFLTFCCAGFVCALCVSLQLKLSAKAARLTKEGVPDAMTKNLKILEVCSCFFAFGFVVPYDNCVSLVKRP